MQPYDLCQSLFFLTVVFDFTLRGSVGIKTIKLSSSSLSNQSLLLSLSFLVKQLSFAMISTLKTRLKYTFSVAKPLKIIFFGSDNVAAPSLAAIYKHRHDSLLQVVTHSASSNTLKAQNKINKYCSQHSIQCISPIKKVNKAQRQAQWRGYSDAILHNFAKQQDLLGVVCSYGYMIPSHIIDLFSKGMIVIHPSLLPKYRGGAPIYHCLANGDTTSGVTYIDISKGKFDAGNILHQVTTPMPITARYKEAEELLAEVAAKEVNYVIDNIDSLRVRSKPQGVDPQFGQAPIVSETKLPLKQENALKLYHLSRAIKSPRLTLSVNDVKKDVIVRLKYEFKDEGEQKTELGGLVAEGSGKNRKLWLKCRDRLLLIESYQEPSRGELPGTAFIDKYMKKDVKVYFE